MQHAINLNINQPQTLKVYDDGNRATVICRMLRPGRFTSGVNGKTFDITIDHLKLARSHYNGKLKEYIKDKFRRELSDDELEIVQMAPVGMEHEINQGIVKGRIIGEVWIEKDDVTGKTWLMGTLEILGKDNVEKVQNGTYKTTSINFNTKTGEITELSFVFKPAIDDSCILSGVTPASIINNDMGKMQEAVMECKKKYTDCINYIDKTENSVAQLRKQIEDMNYRAEFSDKLQGLVKSGKISKVEMKHILTSSENITDSAMFSGVATMLSNLNVRAKRGRMYSTDDAFFKELISNGVSKVDNNKIQEMAEAIKARLTGKTNGNAAFSGGVADKAKKEIDHTQSKDHKIALKDSEEYKQHKAHLKAKGDKEGLKSLCRMAGDTEEDETDDKEKSKEGAKLAGEIKELQDQLAAKVTELETLKTEAAKFKADLDEANVQLKASTMAMETLKQFAGAK